MDLDRIRSIIVPTDFSELSRAAAARAVTFARPDGASIHLLHVVRLPLMAASYEASIPAAAWEGARQGATEKLEAERKAVEELGAASVTTDMFDAGDAARQIAATVEAYEGDLVVMGTHGHTGFRHAFLGSVAERTLRTIDRPILAVKEDPAKAAEPIQRILLAVDFSPHSDHAVEVAAGLAKRFAATVDVIHAFDLPRDYITTTSPFAVEFAQQLRKNASEKLEDVGKRLEEIHLPVTLHVRRGLPSTLIAEAAEEIGCQLIVMGTRGNSGLAHVLLGSVAERTLRAAPCSVLVVRAEEAEEAPANA